MTMLQLLLAILLLLGGGNPSGPILIGYAPDGSLAWVVPGRTVTAENIEKVWHGGAIERVRAPNECYSLTEQEIFFAAGAGLKAYRVTSVRFGKHWQAQVVNPGKLDNDKAKAYYKAQFKRVLAWLGPKEICRVLDEVAFRTARRFGAIYRIGEVRP